MRYPRPAFGVAVCSCALVAAGRAQADVQYAPVALTGASGTAAGYGPNAGQGVDFAGSFGRPVMNASGQVAFSAVLSSADSGVFRFSPGGVTTVARSGSPGPITGLGADVVFGSFTSEFISLNDAGTVAFGNEFSGTGITTSNDTGIFTATGGTVGIIAREGAEPGPNLGAGVLFADMGAAGAVLLNDGGVAAFVARPDDPNPGTSPALFTNSAGTNTVV